MQNVVARTRGDVDTLQNHDYHELETLKQEMTALRLEVTQLRAAVQQQQNFRGHVEGPQPGGPCAGHVARHVADPPELAAIGNGCPHGLQVLFEHPLNPGDPAFSNFRCRNSHNNQCQCWDDLTGMAHRFNIRAGDLDRSFVRIPNHWMERGGAHKRTQYLRFGCTWALH